MAELHDLRGIGPATATALAEHGLTSVKKLAKADLDRITAVPGFGPVRAGIVRAEARAALPSPPVGPPKGAKTPKDPGGSGSVKSPKKGGPSAPKGTKAAKATTGPEGGKAAKGTKGSKKAKAAKGTKTATKAGKTKGKGRKAGAKGKGAKK